jgi:hypothetical protein
MDGSSGGEERARKLTACTGGSRAPPITAASSGYSTLIARLQSCFRSCARYTTAVPPAPRATHRDLTRRLEEMERKYDGKFAVVFNAIRELMAPATEKDGPRPRIGFIREGAAKTHVSATLRVLALFQWAIEEYAFGALRVTLRSTTSIFNGPSRS